MAFNSSTTDLTANSFVTVTEADAYFSDRFGYEKWPTSSKIKKQLLLMASLRINQESFNTTNTTDDRELQFPAKTLTNRYGVVIADTVVPDEIKNATYLQAYSYLREGLFDNDELADLQMVSSLSESTNDGSRSYTIKKIQVDVICAQAKTQLKLLPGIWVQGNKVGYIKR